MSIEEHFAQIAARVKSQLAAANNQPFLFPGLKPKVESTTARLRSRYRSESMEAK